MAKPSTNAQAAIFPPSTPRYDEYIIHEGRDAIIIADVEIPDHDPNVLFAALLSGMRHNIKTLILAGDILATDQQGLNDWISVWKEEKETTYATAIDRTKQILKAYAEWFDEIIFITGNHDDRIQRKTKGEVYIEMLLGSVSDKINFTRYSYMYMDFGDDEWVHISHPTNYSKHSASSLGAELYNVLLSPTDAKCHIVFGHTHLQQFAWSPDGLREIHALGCCRDHARYKDTSTKKFRQWNKAFLRAQEKRPAGTASSSWPAAFSIRCLANEIDTSERNTSFRMQKYFAVHARTKFIGIVGGLTVTPSEEKRMPVQKSHPLRLSSCRFSAQMNLSSAKTNRHRKNNSQVSGCN